MESQSSTITRKQPLALAAVVVGLAAAVLWAYWPVVADMAKRWQEPQYSHGYLVPLFALALLWVRRSRLKGAVWQPSWWGLTLVLAAIGLRILGTRYYFDTLDQLSLVPLLLGLCVLVGGWTAFRWAWPAIGFLVFMMPLPFRLEVGLSLPLRHLATAASTYALQTLGFPAIADGNTILLNDYQIGVAEACSGLSMLMTFIAFSTAVVLVVDLKPLDKAVVLFSAIPLALVTNILRIIVTAALYQWASSHTAQVFFHDLAGLLMMMPVALILLLLELKLLKRLLVEPQAKKPIPLQLGTIVAATSQSGSKPNPKQKPAPTR